MRQLSLLFAVAAITGCASQGMPPGGPTDTAPPTLVKVTPDSGSLGVSPRAVTFRFDEVVSERPRGAASLEQLVMISPSDGAPTVAWGRNEIVVRPRRGWRANTAYSVTILAGLTDLRGNAAKQTFRTVFSTGQSIPTGVVRGVVFDWMAGKSAPGARVEATIGGDTAFRYSAAADSVGRFVLGSLPATTLTIRGWIDQNNNGVRDTREAWDTASVAIADSVRRDLYAFPHDTLGARMAEVTITDSVTIRVRFDHGLRGPLADGQLSLIRARDSAEVRVASVRPAGLADSVMIKARAAREDSVARADTSAKGKIALAKADSLKQAQVRDSVARAQTEAVRAARDTVRRVPPPALDRPVPATEFIVVTVEPMPYDVPLRLTARAVQALVGPARTSERLIQRRKPPPKDTTAVRRPPPRDTTPARKPPPGDTTPAKKPALP